jgi:hypothetical protein
MFESVELAPSHPPHSFSGDDNRSLRFCKNGLVCLECLGYVVIGHVDEDAPGTLFGSEAILKFFVG